VGTSNRIGRFGKHAADGLQISSIKSVTIEIRKISVKKKVKSLWGGEPAGSPTGVTLA